MISRAAIYARTSTLEQEPENQVLELREYCRRRAWSLELEYVDQVSGADFENRPGLDALAKDARRGRFDALVVWRLDRLGRSVVGLVTLLEELERAGVQFVSVNDGIDLSSPAGRFQMQIFAALAEYERAMIRDRVRLGIARARSRGTRIGRPPIAPAPELLESVASLTVREAARVLNCSPASLANWRKQK